jgi:hypothetical protein
MKTNFWENLVNRIVIHWQSSLFGLSYGAIFYMMYQGKITHEQAIGLLTAILAFKSVFVNKDPDKTETKPEVKEKGLNSDNP